jgi:hypothetical protein
MMIASQTLTDVHPFKRLAQFVIDPRSEFTRLKLLGHIIMHFDGSDACR